MVLKIIVDGILKDKSRSLSWLAGEMGKTFDGLKLSLVKGTIKYKDIQVMAKTLNVSPSVFFTEPGTSSYLKNVPVAKLSDGEVKYMDLKNNLKNCREMVSALKDQLKDKEKIISLMSKD